jgi:hypothetical protein
MAMKKLLPILLLFSLLSNLAYAQEWQWAKMVGNENSFTAISKIIAINDNAFAIVGVNNGGLVFDNSMYSSIADDAFYLAIVNAKGQLQTYFQAPFSAANLTITALEVSKDKKIFVSGILRGGTLNLGTDTIQSVGGDGGFVLCFDSTTNFLWAHHFGTLAENKVTAIDIDPDGNVFGGVSTGTGVQIFKLSDEGTLLWTETWLSDRNSELIIEDISIRNSGEIFIVGSIYGQFLIGKENLSAGPQPHALIIQLDDLGQLKNWLIDSSMSVILQVKDVNSQLYIAGVYYEYELGDDQEVYFNEVGTLIGKLTEDFEISNHVYLENLNIPTTFLDFFLRRFAFEMNSDKYGNIYLSGYHYFLKLPSGEILQPAVYQGIEHCRPLIVKFDPSLNYLYAKSIDGDLGDKFYSLALIDEDEFVGAGKYHSSELQFGEHKLLNQGTITALTFTHGQIMAYVRPSISFIAYFGKAISTNTTISSKVKISLHPNPSQDHFYLRSEAFSEKPVQVQLFSTDGKLLSQQNILPMGNSLRVETTSLPPGLYVVGVIVDGQVAAERFVKY